MMRIVRTLAQSTLPAALVALLTAACGGGDGSESGRFVDSPVQGLRYVGPNFSGTTDAEGRYDYRSGDTVCFSVGDIPLGCAIGNGIVTPIDLFDGANSSDDRVVNVVRFLLSLDADGDPENGLDMREVTTTPDNADDIDFAQSATDFGNDPMVTGFVTAEGSNGSLASELDAQMHFEQTLDDGNVLANQLRGTWQYTRASTGIEETERVLADTAKLAELAAESDADTITFVSLEDGEGGEIACQHTSFEIGPVLVMGSVQCAPVDPVPSVQVEIALTSFRLDRIVPGTAFETNDLLGDWLLVPDAVNGQSFPNFGLTPASEIVSFDAQSLASASGSVSSSGAVSFVLDRIDDTLQGGISLPMETCTYTGQMNSTRDYASGSASCSVSGQRFWAIEAFEDLR